MAGEALNSMPAMPPPQLPPVNTDPKAELAKGFSSAAIAATVSLSTLSSSQQEDDDKVRRDGLAAMLTLPFTPLVQNSLSIDELNKIVIQAQQTAVNFMLDKWSEQLKEQADAAKQNWIERITYGFDQIAKNIAQGTEGQGTAIAAASLMMIMTTSLGVPAVGMQEQTASSVPGLTTMQGTAQIIATLEPVAIPGLDMKMVWSFLGPLFATAFLYPAMNEAAAATKETGFKDFGPQLANTYVGQVLNQLYGISIQNSKSPIDVSQIPLNNPNFQNTLLAFLPPGIQQAFLSASGKIQEQFFSAIKVNLLMAAMAMVYTAETGHLTGQEIRSIMEGKMNLPANDPRLTLRTLVQRELKKLSGGEAILNEMYAYFDRNPSGENLRGLIEGWRKQWSTDSIPGPLEA